MSVCLRKTLEDGYDRDAQILGRYPSFDGHGSIIALVSPGMNSLAENLFVT